MLCRLPPHPKLHQTMGDSAQQNTRSLSSFSAELQVLAKNQNPTAGTSCFLQLKTYPPLQAKGKSPGAWTDFFPISWLLLCSTKCITKVLTQRKEYYL